MMTHKKKKGSGNGGQLYAFRKGWQGETLAEYILSQFSFIARPKYVADDVGTDFFCTFFDIPREETKDYCIPQFSFAIQVKSNPTKWDVSAKLSYLRDLELPFFVGVADKKRLTLTLYSGRSLRTFFAMVKPDENWTVTIVPEDNPKKELGYDENLRQGWISFPKVVEIPADFEYPNNKAVLEGFCKESRCMLENIASNVKKEYPLKFPNGGDFSVLDGKIEERLFPNFLTTLVQILENLAVMVNPTYARLIPIPRNVQAYLDCFEQISVVLNKSGLLQGTNTLHAKVLLSIALLQRALHPETREGN